MNVTLEAAVLLLNEVKIHLAPEFDSGKIKEIDRVINRIQIEKLEPVQLSRVIAHLITK